jgi:signal transduction histidine kinase
LELTNALEREKELSEMKSRFVSMASHEFRTPLSAILSSVSLVDHYKAEEHDEKRIKHIERIKSSVRNLTEILDGFLSIDKLEQGRVEVKCDHFQLDEFVEDVIEEMEGTLKKKNQSIEYVFKGVMEIQQDKKILRNVLLNLLSNASKYSPEEKSIYVLIDAGENMVSASIRDEGIGIPMEAQKDLFGKFFRANNAVNIQGTGLGLNIVQKYVELLEGTIEFTSKENEGSTFTITFPRSLG